MVSMLSSATPKENEDTATFHRRRQREAALAIAHQGKWSDDLLLRSHGWDAHCKRALVVSPAARFLKLDRLSSLQQLRAAFIFAHGTQGDTIGLGAGRFGLRAGRGRPATRWEEAIENSKAQVQQLKADRSDSKSRPKCRRVGLASASRRDVTC